MMSLKKTTKTGLQNVQNVDALMNLILINCALAKFNYVQI
jgi:hypothetical protein